MFIGMYKIKYFSFILKIENKNEKRLICSSESSIIAQLKIETNEIHRWQAMLNRTMTIDDFILNLLSHILINKILRALRLFIFVSINLLLIIFFLFAMVWSLGRYGKI